MGWLAQRYPPAKEGEIFDRKKYPGKRTMDISFIHNFLEAKDEANRKECVTRIKGYNYKVSAAKDNKDLE